MDEKAFDVYDFMHQLQSFRQVLDKVRATNEGLLSAATRQCSASDDESFSESFTEVKNQIELLGNRMEKRDAEIHVLHESLSHIASKLNDTVQLIRQKSKSENMRVKNTREKRRKTEIDQAQSETNILETNAARVLQNAPNPTDVSISAHSPGTLESENDNLSLTNFASNTLRDGEQKQNISINAKSEGKSLNDTVTRNGLTNTRSHTLLTNQENNHKPNIPLSNQSHKPLQNILDDVNREKRTSKTTDVHHDATLTSEQRHESQHYLPSLQKDNFGFKRRLTQETDDNRTIYLTENKNSQSEKVQGCQAEGGNVTKYTNDLANTSVGLLEMSDDDSMAEIGFREWFSHAEDEKRKGSQMKISRGCGPDTVLCLDVSGSMAGEPFKHMISIAIQIVEGIKQVHYNLAIQENVSVTTFGAESKVVIHLTDKYDDVIDTIKRIPHPKGPSPMAGGLLVALAGCLGNGAFVLRPPHYSELRPGKSVPTMVITEKLTSVLRPPVMVHCTCTHQGARLVSMLTTATFFSNKNLVVGARVVLISDGRATPDHIRIDHDNILMDAAANFRVDFNLNSVARNLKKRHIKVFCIPVKDAYMTTLKKVSGITYGKVYYPTDIPRVIKYAQNLLQALDIIVTADVAEAADTRTAYNAAFDTIPSPHRRPEDKEDVVDLAVSLQKEALPEREQAVERYPDLPPLGTRVCRGPGWHYGSQDTNGPGTVYSHGKSGLVWVKWDNGHQNCYNYRIVKDIVEVDTPRILGHNELIEVGCRVKRGPDFRENRKLGEIKPHDIGVVVKVREDGVIHVRWPNKKVGLHGYGADGRFELTICGENEVHTPRSRPERPIQERRAASPDDELRIESFLSPHY